MAKAGRIGYTGWARRPTRGFTLAEVLVTATIVAIVAGAAVPLVAARLQDYRLRAVAWQLAGDLRLGRQRAVTTRVRYRVVFAVRGAATDPDSYAIEYATRPAGAEVWVRERPLAAGVRFHVGSGIHIDPASTPRTGQIAFNPNGSVVPTGSIRLAGPRGIMTVTIDQVGRVQVDEP
jgi:prepilin-type N-terminal cleavage/methylation domain-containing protein